jgi:hypothetical protein
MPTSVLIAFGGVLLFILVLMVIGLMATAKPGSSKKEQMELRLGQRRSSDELVGTR